MRSLILGLSIFILPVQVFADTPQAKDSEPKTVQELLNKVGFDLAKAELSLPRSDMYQEYKDKICPKLKNEIMTRDIPLKEPLVASDDYEDIKPVIGGCPLSMFEFHSVSVVQPALYPKSDYRVYKLSETDNFLVYIGNYEYSEDVQEKENYTPTGKKYYIINNKCERIRSGQTIIDGLVRFFEKDVLFIINASQKSTPIAPVNLMGGMCPFIDLRK